MRKLLLMFMFLALASVVCGAPKTTAPRPSQTAPTQVRERRPSAAPEGSQHWEANHVGPVPWTFDLKIGGDNVTGVVGTPLIGPFKIYDGKVSGNNIEFKVKTADGSRIVTFQGIRNGDSIAFKRSVQIISGRGPSTGILGTEGVAEFVATMGH